MATWVEVTRERYWKMLEVLPPSFQNGHGFLMGEPCDHRPCKVTGYMLPRYAAFVQRGDRYFGAAVPMSIPEFKAVKLDEVA